MLGLATGGGKIGRSVAWRDKNGYVGDQLQASNTVMVRNFRSFVTLALYGSTCMPLGQNFKKSPSSILYLQFLQPNKSILIHTAPVYVLGTTLTYRAANGGANQFTTMVLLSLFPIKCCEKNQEHVIKNVSGDKQDKQYTSVFTRDHILWTFCAIYSQTGWLVTSRLLLKGRARVDRKEEFFSFSSFPSPLALPSVRLLATRVELAKTERANVR